eukprot:snap_masked-scaffold_11-processed-gene-2.2-mRNA-1 protein AED:1.00 eAED:1.00 QI:0/0/0/0/1/1/2/0/432
MYFANKENRRPTLKGLNFQTKIQKELVDLYFDSVQIDTTHGLSKYVFVSMFPVGVDCLMKTVNFGCSLMQTENNVDVTRGLTDLELKKMKVIMSDGSLALAKSAHDLGAVHVRCVKHLFSSFSSGAKRLRGTDFKTFMDSLNKLVREDLGSESQFDEEMYNVMSKFQDHEQQTFLKNIKENKTSMCWTFVKSNLTFDMFQPNVLKDFILRRRKLSLKQKRWTLDQLVSYQDKQVEDYIRSTLRKIKKLVVEGGDVSDEVSERLTVELKKVHGCFISLDRGDKTYLVVEKVNRESRTFEMTIERVDDIIIPRCTCACWINFNLPCRHFTRVSIKLEVQYIQKMHLLPRWRFENHPLFIAAMKVLERAESSEDDALNFNVKVPDFKDLLVPKKTGVRYSMLQRACKTLCEEAQHSTDEGWRKAYATFIRMTDAL